MGLEQVKLVELPKISDSRGSLTFIENKHIPFEVRRVYYLYDIGAGEKRGSHAHKNLQQLIIAASGSFDVVLDDGKNRQTFHLNRSHCGLYLPRLLWRDLENFSAGSFCLVLASEPYDENDYFRNYDEFIEHVNGKKGEPAREYTFS
ncbi:FdtA/QdtA family cupin domain-containing protein [Paenibacillus filicis]|uniref:FdtA/QdtA family cupin domain-containing protein n=1 Tax=Paenibacillus gyeongsangnamensis TaxID=3388067 RepID=A0ABT4Q8R1_9BACL|nr:FdtA/QdtA family cupin domain-containing protein [Paenibacillus filicis]MCZ8513172.1 FdtA/QdtA family cupin domain-containing protein [Paenibacillus filicis]